MILSKISMTFYSPSLQAKNQPNSQFKVASPWNEKFSNPPPTYGDLRLKSPIVKGKHAMQYPEVLSWI